MSVEYTVGQLRRATEEKKVLWYRQTDGMLTAVYKVGENDFSLSLYKDHRNLVIFKIAFKNIMRTDILQKDRVIWPNSPANKLLKKFWKTEKSAPKGPEGKLNSDLDAIYEIADSAAVEPEKSREMLLKLISGF
ncbi:hypothetical protein A2W54_02965 [Candidatus Giovannonibacteria bacterium RIFCSPHIGHO2_02_43_13]|uniref:Uncharacterized protein n=1 Tax=Candidatus Giovannonibacteria bacterium RIFCSPHIGHO2_02_43_13 TaxID=1798330 RepID=A0A1F5WSW9_9BACT|nr:MAG: hypothetical protein UW28_C0027G0016 [Parcubacteria group bacterium GW2011_GWA2_44_13]OGF74758.1 MAG: hypothetical protein A3E06_01895 [Candidatus Giovannonibacteria bacterium RIFCSPHIGHO2_12_FULL_44_42]OGF78727.1 MAG: hypothetical protein A2W54_02965 [Candidatus Giovannonibacteria bacterium RIFCSPHIGHO2_02_43_13]OGF88779.1 MAG: hypothetical protein A3I94_02725 [Candidatus Giovannonibacteria bacterium RIFCSPLOWO2_02_FULL_43_54]OGF97182.1 MAG: hypothetical protein A3H08_00320 [Candidatus